MTGVKLSITGAGRPCRAGRLRATRSRRARKPVRGPVRDRPVDRLLQSLATAFGLRWTHARRGLRWMRCAVSGACPGDGAGGAGGMKFIMGSHLTIAAKLSNDWGPPLYQAHAPKTHPILLSLINFPGGLSGRLCLAACGLCFDAKVSTAHKSMSDVAMLSIISSRNLLVLDSRFSRLSSNGTDAK